MQKVYPTVEWLRSLEAFVLPHLGEKFGAQTVLCLNHTLLVNDQSRRSNKESDQDEQL
jgi:hypothetical protein